MSASARDCLENTSSRANCFARRDAGVRNQMVPKKSVDVAACLASCDDEYMRRGLARLVSPSGHVSEAWIPEGLQGVPAEGLGDARTMAFSPSTISPSRLDTLPSNARCLATPPPTVAGGGPGPMRVSSIGSMRQSDDMFSSFLHERNNCSSQYVVSDSTPKKSGRSGSCVSAVTHWTHNPAHDTQHKTTCRMSLYQTAPEMGSAQNHFKDSRHDHTSLHNRVVCVCVCLCVCVCASLQMEACRHNTLQHTATHCNTLQYTAIHCNTLQHTASHCNTLQHTAAHCTIFQHTEQLYAHHPFRTWGSSI